MCRVRGFYSLQSLNYLLRWGLPRRVHSHRGEQSLSFICRSEVWQTSETYHITTCNTRWSSLSRKDMLSHKDQLDFSYILFISSFLYILFSYHLYLEEAFSLFFVMTLAKCIFFFLKFHSEQEVIILRLQT